MQYGCYFLYLFLLLRNEQYQEELWKRSFEFLKDHLSPETVEKYGPPSEPPGTNEAEGTDVDGEKEQGQQTDWSRISTRNHYINLYQIC